MTYVMPPIRTRWICQVDVTSRCPRSCVQCNRFTSLRREDRHFHMSLDYLEKAFDSLDREWSNGKIGIIGGEPLIHPEFKQLSEMVRKRWTAKGRWCMLFTSLPDALDKHKDLVRRCYTKVNVNDKQGPDKTHQRIMVASRDVIYNARLRRLIQTRCWVPKFWAPSITPLGVYFCEIAASICGTLRGPDGWALDEPWGTYTAPDYERQRWACDWCGMCIPQEKDRVDDNVTSISVSWWKAMKDNEIKPIKNWRFANIGILTEEEFVDLAKGWNPGEYQRGKVKGGLR